MDFNPQPREALHGLAGHFVNTVAPHTEADPAALLTQFLAAVGSVLGPRLYFQIDADRHPSRLNVVLVGRSAVGRKGTSWGWVKRVVGTAAPEWKAMCLAAGW